VIVATVTDDKKIQEIMAMKVTAVRFTDMARARIVNAGGECLTFNQLALRVPLGQNTVCIISIHVSKYGGSEQCLILIGGYDIKILS
jgi:ribosomal protein L18E